MTMNAISKKSRKKHEDERVDENEKADLAAGQRGQQVFDPDVTVDTVEGQRENPGSDQNENHECREFRGRLCGLTDQIPAQPALSGAKDNRAAGAHRAALGRRREADKDRA